MGFERVLLTIAALAAVCSAVGFWAAYLKSTKLGRTTRKSEHLNVPYEQRALATPPISDTKWADPERSTSAAKWTYDLFTPPEIFYDESSKRFTVTPPRTALGENETASASESEPLIQLLSVNPVLYRLQLIGYVGTKTGFLGLFENATTQETFLSGARKDLTELDLAIESFDVELATVALADGMSTRQLVAMATVRDHRTGNAVRLTTTERCYCSPRAVLCLERGSPREVCMGDVLNISGTDYEVSQVQLSPARVALRRLAKNESASESLTLEMSLTAADGVAAPSI